MPTEIVYLIATVAVSLVALYFIIRLAATHALNRHAVWMRDGSVDRAIARRREATADEEYLRGR